MATTTHVFERLPDGWVSDGVIMLDVQRDVLCGALSGSAGQTYCLKDVVQRVEAFARHQSLVRWFSSGGKQTSKSKRVLVSSACVLELAPVLRAIHDVVKSCDDVELRIHCDESAEAMAAVKSALRGAKDVRYHFHHPLVAADDGKKCPSSTLEDARSLCRTMAASAGPERERFRNRAFHDDELLMMLYENAPRLCPSLDVLRLNRFFVDASILAGPSSTTISAAAGSPLIDASYEIKQRALLCALPERSCGKRSMTWTRAIALALTSQRSSIARHLKKPDDWYARLVRADRSSVDPYDRAVSAAWSS